MAEGRRDALADFTTDRRVLVLTLMALGRSGVMAARVRAFEEEHVRERGDGAR
ncbi:MAG: hypothetical protein ACM3SU_14280 [Acidobacteriota bacterium]